MVMIQSGRPIEQLELGIRRRLWLLAVQDLIVFSSLVSAGFALIGLILLRLGLFDARIAQGIGTRGRLLLSTIPLAAAAGLLALRTFLRSRGRWRSSLATGADQADLMIDRAMDLEDRTRTAGSVIRRGGPANVMETALVEDAASRLAQTRAERIVAYRAPRLDFAIRCYTSVGSSIVLGLIVLVAIIQYRLPAPGIGEMDGATIAVMQAVGEDLEKSSEAIERSVKPETPTAALARQQGELAHALKEGATPKGRNRGRQISRAQALKELSAIEEKLGSRKNELENTRASEIISLAERRFESTISGSTNLRHPPVAEQPGTDKAELSDGGARTAKDKGARADNRRSQADQGHEGKRSATDKSAPQDRPAVADKQGDPDSRPVAKPSQSGQEAISDKAVDKSLPGDKPPLSNKPGEVNKPAAADASQAREDGTPNSKAAGKAGPDQASQADARPAEQQSDGSQRAAKDETPPITPELKPAVDAGTGTLPSLSEDLIKKAAEMRANNITPADVEQVRKAAEGLLKDLSAKDLANLANSKEIQQTLEQLARQVNPKQMEQLARQLLSQKEVRDELQAIGKLLTENRQAKEMIAGFADKAREIAEQWKQQGYRPGTPPDGLKPPPGFPGQNNPGAGSEPGSGRGGAERSYGRAGSSAEALNGASRSGESVRRAARTENMTDARPEGEPIYGRARPGSAPALVPYSAAYPGYRREAERSVQRSQVPPRLRAMIRNYFDAINPDVEKHP